MTWTMRLHGAGRGDGDFALFVPYFAY